MRFGSKLGSGPKVHHHQWQTIEHALPELALVACFKLLFYHRYLLYVKFSLINSWVLKNVSQKTHFHAFMAVSLKSYQEKTSLTDACTALTCLSCQSLFATRHQVSVDEIKGILFSKIINLGASYQVTPEPHLNITIKNPHQLSPLK